MRHRILTVIVLLFSTLAGAALVTFAADPEWIQHTERVVAEGHPELPDVVNRPAKQIWGNFTSQHMADGAHRPLMINHADLLDRGTNSHATLDAHLIDGAIHFAQTSINHNNLVNRGANSHATLDAHLSNSATHYAQGAIDHTSIQNIGANSHADIDSHMADGTQHYAQGAIDHAEIQNIGANSHADIDSHIADSAQHFPIDDTLTTGADRVWSSAFSTAQIAAQISAAVFSSGAADMQTAIYDTDSNGIVDAVDNAAPALSVTDDTTTISGVDLLRFNPASGFSVADDGNGDVTVNLGSSWNPIQVSGQADLDATGEEALEIVAGENITLTTNTASQPQTLTISAAGGVFDGNLNAPLVLNNQTTAPEAQAAASILYTKTVTVPGAGNDGFVSLLIPSNHTEGSTEIHDVSVNAHAVTRYGGITHTTLSSAVGASSLSFDGVDDRLSIADHATLEPGTGDFTIELWLKLPNLASSVYVLNKYDSTGNQRGFAIFKNSTHYLTFYSTDNGVGDSGHSITFTTASTIPLNTWFHAAIVRSGTSLTWYINGTATGTTTASMGIYDTTVPLNIGYSIPTFSTLSIDGLRLSKGIARYTSNFTPYAFPRIDTEDYRLFVQQPTSAEYDVIGHITDGDRHVDGGVVKLPDISAPNIDLQNYQLFISNNNLYVMDTNGQLYTIALTPAP